MLPDGKVADINFSYDNGFLIKMLKKRGKAIHEKDLQKEEKLNK